MTESLLTRSVSKVPDRVRFQGRVLFLAEDPALIHRQLAGEDLAFDPSAPVGTRASEAPENLDRRDHPA